MDRVIRYLIVGLGLGAVGWGVWFFRELVFFLLIGLVLAYVLGPLVDWFQQFGINRIVSVLLTFIIVLGLFSFLLASLIPFIKTQALDLATLVAPENLNRIGRSIERTMGSILPIEEGQIIEGLRKTFTALFGQERITSAVSFTVDLFANIAYALIVVPLITFFMVKDGPLLRNQVLRLVPNRYFEITLNLFEKIETNIGFYFKALFLRTIAISIIASLLLSMVGMQYAVIVGIFTGLANTIPYFGPAIGFMAGSIVGIAQTGDFSLVPGVFLAMAVTQVVDNILQPYIFARATRVHPLVILCCVLIGAELAGIIGMLMAIPILTIALATVKQILWSLRNYYIFRAA
jgi:predicted PurR-regulated permease PerM